MVRIQDHRLEEQWRILRGQGAMEGEMESAQYLRGAGGGVLGGGG